MQDHAAFSAHSDVLEAPLPAPGTPARAALLEELKRRGKSAVGAGQWPHAAALYNKALEVAACDYDGDETGGVATNQQCAILNANLSLVHAKMHHFDKAVVTAETATRQDPQYVKAWWRLGQACAALQKYERAVQALETAVGMEPDNKALKKELDKNQKALVEQKLQEQERQQKENATASNSTQTTTTTTSVVMEEKAPKSAAAATTVHADDEDDERIFSKSEHVRGYKIVNGKKTSYFHNELSEDAAKLIGDIAPKKLEDVPAVVGGATSEQGTSAWNKAGTWGECSCIRVVWTNNAVLRSACRMRTV